MTAPPAVFSNSGGASGWMVASLLALITKFGATSSRVHPQGEALEMAVLLTILHFFLILKDICRNQT